ncbi:MAG: NAD(P)H-dependent oxidoreductase subunit E [Lentisphaeria bacterium]|nr:NAD(P)H-dependent oxidoreductase subunit E [Lentisphaeria bacterium]
MTHLTDEKVIEWVDQMAASHTAVGGLVGLLQEIQARFGYLPVMALTRLAEVSDHTPAQISGAATFYSQFRLQPAGEHMISVCVGTACHVKGAPQLIEAFKRHLNIAPDQDTDAERRFTIEGVACLGCCMLAPAVRIGDLIYGPVTAANVDGVIDDFLLESAKTDEAEAPLDSDDDLIEGEARLCLCSSCRAAGADRTAARIQTVIREFDLPVRLRETACTGISFETPLVEIAARGDERRFRYGCVDETMAEGVLFAHFSPARWSRKLKAFTRRGVSRLYDGAERARARSLTASVDEGTEAFAKGQVRIATARAGEPGNLDLAGYQAAGGFQALAKCGNELTSDDVIDMLAAAGLRGRGGAGFPTAEKWRAVRAADSAEKVLICNADEGDPGAFMDRMMVESFPFRLIEGMAIAARVLGIQEGFVYVRAEYPLAVRRLSAAIAMCEKAGILLAETTETFSNSDSSARLRLNVIQGAGAFVCGEETALIAAVEGGRGEPRLRPPYPSQRGLRGQPTLVNNVETFSVIPWIIQHGAAAFAAWGTADSRGTKTFALAGKVRRGGLIEVPMGMTIRQIVNDIGGGVEPGRTLKAVQVGGPSGGCVPAALLDTPVDYTALNHVGAMMGSGGMVVLDNTDCMVDVARYFMTFIQDESCGKCTCCRIGTWEMLAILERLCAGKGRPGDVEELKRLGEIVRTGSLCGLGKTAPNPVLSTLAFFEDEYLAHIQGHCPAGKCRDLIHFTISDRCIGCTRCAQVCPAGAIQPTPYRKHDIDDSLCIRCGACRNACPSSAIQAR